MILAVQDTTSLNYNTHERTKDIVDRAVQNGRLFLIRIVQNRMTAGNGRILDEIRKKTARGARGHGSPRFKAESERQAACGLPLCGCAGGTTHTRYMDLGS